MRICDRQGWLIHVVSETGVGTQIEIVLDPVIET
jgi:hypothetical protein